MFCMAPLLGKPSLECVLHISNLVSQHVAMRAQGITWRAQAACKAEKSTQQVAHAIKHMHVSYQRHARRRTVEQAQRDVEHDVGQDNIADQDADGGADPPGGVVQVVRAQDGLPQGLARAARAGHLPAGRRELRQRQRPEGRNRTPVSSACCKGM